MDKFYYTEVYHGSDSNFKFFRVGKDLVRSNATMLNEGLGVYFSTDRQIAEKYGRYLYTIKIKRNEIKDFNNKSSCRNFYVKLGIHLYNTLGINIWDYVNIEELANRLNELNLSIYENRELQILLENSENFNENHSLNQIKKLGPTIKNFKKENLAAYLFPSEHKNIGIIKKLDLIKEIKKIDNINKK